MIGLMNSVENPVEDCKQVVVPLTAHLPTILASVGASVRASMRTLSALSAASRAATSLVICCCSELSPACRAAASLVICCWSAAVSGIGTQVMFLPLGSEDCIACPAGHPVTFCAQAPWAPNATTAAAKPQRQ